VDIIHRSRSLLVAALPGPLPKGPFVSPACSGRDRKASNECRLRSLLLGRRLNLTGSGQQSGRHGVALCTRLVRLRAGGMQVGPPSPPRREPGQPAGAGPGTEERSIRRAVFGIRSCKSPAGVDRVRWWGAVALVRADTLSVPRVARPSPHSALSRSAVQGHRGSCPSVRTRQRVSLPVARWPSPVARPRRTDESELDHVTARDQHCGSVQNEPGFNHWLYARISARYASQRARRALAASARTSSLAAPARLLCFPQWRSGPAVPTAVDVCGH
jgi:hypothetical protein